MRKLLVFLFLFIFSLSVCFAAPLRGLVRDAATGELLAGVLVTIKGTTLHTTTGLDGKFTFSNVPSGNVTLVTGLISYRKLEKSVHVTDKSRPEIKLDLISFENVLSHVTISAFSKNSDGSVRNLERIAPNVVNIIGAKAIELSPDITVANVVQRVSGVSMERSSSGEGQYAILRGMDKRFNYTLVNGIKIPGPDNKNRFVPLDIFPAELLDRLEVSKSLTPDMEGDAIGGVVNMVMKDAPSRFRLNFNMATGYNSLFFNHDFQSYNTNAASKLSPYEQYGAAYPARFKDFASGITNQNSARAFPNFTAGFSVGNRFWYNKLGVVLAASMQQTSRGSNSNYFGSETASSDASNLPVLKDWQTRFYSNLQSRYGVHAKVDFKPSPQHNLQLYSAWISMNTMQIRDVRNVDLLIGYNPEANDYNVSYSTRFRQTKQAVFTNTLHGAHRFLNRFVLLDWNLVYSRASNNVPANTTINTLSNVRNGQEKYIAVNTLDGASIRWEHNSDQDKAFYFKAHMAPEKKLSLTTGAMYRAKTRSNFFNEYTLTPYDPATGSNNLIKGINWTGYDQISFAVKNPYGSVGDPLNYKATENIGAAFLMGKFEDARWKIIAGLRIEHTDQGYNLLHAVEGVQNVGNQTYYDWLPSLNMKYSPWEKTNLRLSYYRSVNRPGFFEIVPYNVVNEEFTEKGNPVLKHTVAHNFDLRYEVFPQPAGQFMAGLFYKRIQDPIEYGMVATGQGSFFMPDNFGTATNYGIELDAIRFFNAFGIKANYTYTHSRITTSKLLNYTDPNSGSTANILTKNVDQSRPLYGQSPSVANLALLYKNTDFAIDAQIMGVYTGKRIYALSRYFDNDMWEDQNFQLDASVEKRWGSRWSLFAKASNLLNSPMVVYLNKTNPANDQVTSMEFVHGGTLVRKDRYGVQMQVGLRLKLD